MAMGLQLQDRSGTLLVDLNNPNSGTRVMRYVPGSPQPQPRWVPEHNRDGGRVQSISHEPVTDEVVIQVNTATSRQVLVDIGWCMARAKEYANGRRGSIIRPIYVAWKPHGDSTYYQSRVHYGYTVLDPGAMSVGQWGSGKVYVVLRFVRDPWWEGPLTLCQWRGYEGDLLTAPRVKNEYYSPTPAWNYLELRNFPSGDLPTPLKLNVKYDSNDGSRASTIWVTHANWANWYLAGNHTLQAESGSLGTLVTNAAYSGPATNNGRSSTFATSTLTTLVQWDLSAGVVAMMDGQWFRLLGRVNNWTVASDVRMCVEVAVDGMLGLAPLYRTPLVQMPWSLGSAGAPVFVDFGVVRIPPTVHGLNTAYYPLDIGLRGLRDSGASTTFELDYLYMLPTNQARVYTPRGFNLPYNFTLVDDMTEDQLYVLSSTSQALNHYTVQGEPFMLFPSQPSWLYFAASHDTGGGFKGQTFVVQGWYRSRRTHL